MACTSFLGRVLFVSVFLLSAWLEINEFGSDGGPAARSLEPKINHYSKYISQETGLKLPDIEVKYIAAATIGLRVLGSFLFIFGSSFGAQLLILHQLIFPVVLYDFYNYDVDDKKFSQLFVKFTQNLALMGALLFFIGMKNSMPKRLKKKAAAKTKTN